MLIAGNLTLPIDPLGNSSSIRDQFHIVLKHDEVRENILIALLCKKN